MHIKYAKDPIRASEMALQKPKSSSRPPDKAREATKSSRPVHSAPRLTDKNQAGECEPLDRNKLLLRHQPSDGLDRARVLERAQPVMLGGAAYLGLARCLTGEHPELMELAAPGALSFLEEMCPKDALERLALTQTLLAHARAAYLTKVLTSQTEAAVLGIVGDACERAAGTFARLMRAIAEYRQPKSPSTTVSIGQANLASQQVVQNVQKLEGTQKENDEQTRINGREAAIDAEAVPVVKKRAEITKGCNPGNEAVGEEHRAKEPGRKSHGRNERASARREVSRSHRDAKTGSTDC